MTLFYQEFVLDLPLLASLCSTFAQCFSIIMAKDQF